MTTRCYRYGVDGVLVEAARGMTWEPFDAVVQERHRVLVGGVEVELYLSLGEPMRQAYLDDLGRELAKEKR